MPLLFLAGILLLVFLLQNFLYNHRMFSRLSYRCYFSTDEAYEGDEIELVEEIENRKLLPVPWLRSDFTASKYLRFAGTRSVVTGKDRFVVSFFMLKSYHKVTRRWKVKCTKRGIYSIEKVSLVATEPLGNCVIAKNIYTGVSLTVLPSPQLPASLDFQVRHLMGDVTVRRHLVSDPFTIAGTREYQPSDPLKLVDWPATARTGHLMVRECAFTTSPSLAVVLNLQSREFEVGAVLEEDLVENAIRLCAGLFYATLADGVPVEFYCNTHLPQGENPLFSSPEGGVVTRSDFGVSHVRDLLRLLAALPLESSQLFPQFLEQGLSECQASDLIIVTPYLCEEIFQYARERSGVRILMTGPAEPEQLPADVSVKLFYAYFRDQLEQQAREEGGRQECA